MRLLVVSLACLLATACGASSGPPSVDWAKYDQTGLRDVARKAVADKDCSSMQAAFDAADGSSDAYRAKYGEGNADLMSYLDWQMKHADCY